VETVVLQGGSRNVEIASIEVHEVENLLHVHSKGSTEQGVSTPYSPVVTIYTARFNIQQFHVLTTQRIYVFCVDLRTNSHYFLIQH